MAADVILAGLKPDGLPGELMRIQVPDGKPYNLGRYGDGRGYSTFIKDTGEGEVHVFDGEVINEELNEIGGRPNTRLKVVRHLFTVALGEQKSVHVYDPEKNKVRLTVRGVGTYSIKPLMFFGHTQYPQ